MYRCIECGRIFEEGEEAVWYEDRGEYWGIPCRERVTGCPSCRGDYEEVFQCEECGEWFFEDELEDGLCEDCINEKEKNDDHI